MSLFGGIVTYVMLWWLVLFMVLPFGVRTPSEAGEAPVAGQADSAPVRPRMWTKLLVTTVIAAVLFVGVYYVIDRRLIPLDRLPGV